MNYMYVVRKKQAWDDQPINFQNLLAIHNFIDIMCIKILKEVSE